VLVTTALLTGVGAWTYHAVESSLRELRAASLRSLLDSEVNALRLWVTEEIGYAERVAREPQARAAIQQLRGDPQCTGPAREQLEERLRPVLRKESEATFNVVDRDGRLLATRHYCGFSLTARFRAALAPAFEGRSLFVRPFRDEERVDGVQQVRAGAPFAWIAVPVRDGGGSVIAALAIAEPIDAVFASILQAARPGSTGESLAFDERGEILSPGRFGETAPLRALAREGEDGGVVLEPYINHRGARVIGAWRWLPEYGMGVGLEMEATEAYAPLRVLQGAFGVVFGALVLASIAALASALSVLRMRGVRKMGAYRLEREIGEGGVATVYLARHDLLKRPTAVKVLKLTRSSDEQLARFEREVQLASSLSHPNTVEIFDYGRTREGRLYYAMEYLDGLTIAQVVERSGPLPPARAIYLLRQVCAALAEAHGRGLVHRDIKPENIMACRYGGEHDFVKLLDFGLVKHVQEKHSRDLTRGLKILGTPLYMAPERLRNPAETDPRSDIYSVGAVAFFMLAGKRPFEGGDDLALASRILNDEAPRVSAVATQPVPTEVDMLVQACLEKKPADRPQRVTDLVEACDALALEHRWTQREAEAWWQSTQS
jgi:serine/threonine-protein kinase